MKDKLWNRINSSSAASGLRNIEIKKADERRGAVSVYRKSERGVALLIVLILSAVALAIMTALIYMTTIGTQTSGMQKRYHSALEAGIAGKDVLTLVIQNGDTSTIGNLSPNVETSSLCTGTDINTGMSYTGIRAKLMTSTTGTTGTGWSSGCDTYLKIDPLTPTSYDLRFTLGNNPQYTVYSKIVDVVKGNTSGSNSSGTNLNSKGVVATYGSGEIAVTTIPSLYTVEIDVENASSNSKERAKLQVLYQN
jgi:hypothetical protein